MEHGRSGGVAGGHGDHPENRHVPAEPHIPSPAGGRLGDSTLQHHNQRMLVGAMGGVMASGNYQNWPTYGSPNHIDTPRDVVAQAHEKHEDQIRHLLLRKMPTFKESWSDEVKTEWLRAFVGVCEHIGQ